MGKTFKDIRKVKPEVYKATKKVKKWVDKDDIVKYVCQQCGSTVRTDDDYPKCPHCGGELIPN
ncbi:hypothetical protein [Romboutsia sp.]|uniref:hypothetical protein n=1 Tax=Romboutsia sp. TaxID=1965302 RepID=UPI003F37718C